MTTRDDALTELADTVGQALLRFAEQWRTPPPALVTGTPAVPQSAEPGLGAAQQRVLDALVAAGGDGMTSHEVAKATGLQNSNTPRILKTLQGRGLARSSGEKPAVWAAYAEPPTS